MGTNNTSIRPPKDWQDFERKSVVLFRCILGDPNVQGNGRQGQKQHGVDVFGYRNQNGNLVGIQCKGKNQNYASYVTVAELRREVEEAKSFKPELKEFIIITTAPDDANIQQEARIITQELASSCHPFSVHVWGWDTLENRISEYPDAIKAFDPNYNSVLEQQLITQNSMLAGNTPIFSVFHK